ncbi:MAG: hypothetical protein ACLR1V_01260 [Coprococcus sp.]
MCGLTMAATMWLQNYVKAHTQMDYAEYTEPNRVVMNTKWEEQQTVTLKKDTAVRYKGGVKSEVLRQANKGEKMVLLEAYDDWSNVADRRWIMSDGCPTRHCRTTGD